MTFTRNCSTSARPMTVCLDDNRNDHSYRQGVNLASVSTLETRYRYKPDVKILPARVPAAIPMLLMRIPAMLAALSVVREKELGSIINR